MLKDHQADFTSALGCLIEPALSGLAAQLGGIPALAKNERVAVREALAEALYETVHRRVSRVLLLELNAARVTGVLTSATPSLRWEEFLEKSARTEFWDSLTEQYPALMPRLERLISNRCHAALIMARRFADDRQALGPLLRAEPGQLVRVSFSAGDAHRGGQTVAILQCTAGLVVYKPRSLDVDAALGDMLAGVLGNEPGTSPIRVPKVVTRQGYGWAEHIAHRYCTDARELTAFYTAIGHWLAIIRLLGGSDLHAENLVACGPVPVVVDCETLFTPHPAAAPTGLGLAVDQARRIVDGSVLRTGLLPGRGLALGWRGVDSSGAGALPGQQPLWEQPVIVEAGTDRARVGSALVPVVPVITNHPSPDLALGQYWHHVTAGFTDLTDRLFAMDKAGTLEPLLAGFADCAVRVVPRATEVYAELGRMLWHPVSLHDEAGAIERAMQLLLKSGQAIPLAPTDPVVIAAEIVELLDGDIPFFSTTPRRGRLEGPGGTTWLPEMNLIDDALGRWRAADLPFERRVIQATLVSAYLNDGWLPEERSLRVEVPRTDDVDTRRRLLAAAILRQTAGAALRAEDGTVTWIAPVLNLTGWAVEPLGSDLYGGVPGVAVLVAAYLHEMTEGHADEVEGLEPLLACALRTMRAAEDWEGRHRQAGIEMRPPLPGGYIGLGSEIWAWLTLDRLGAAGDGVERARARAELVPAAVQADDTFDVLTGTAGVIVPLLHLAAATGDGRWLDQAVVAGERLVSAAKVGVDGARWPTARWPHGLGGFAHGASGIGWALRRLALACGDDRFRAMATAAFSFEQSLYDDHAGGWRDLREPGVTAAAWCHGSVGIGLAAADLARYGERPGEIDDRIFDVIRRAAGASWASGIGWNHTLCHGDLGAWEVLDAALAMGLQPAGLEATTLEAHVISSLEEHGPVSGFARDAFAPGMLAGSGGMAYQLLRMNPSCQLPSVLTLGAGRL